MKIVFADTGYWQAVLNPKDNLHTKALAISRDLGKPRIITTEMVLDELLAALSPLPERAYAIRGVDAIRSDPNVVVIPQTSIQFREAFDRYKRMADKSWSLTDCASFEIMEARGITEALAHDSHFEQAGFVALLRD